MNVPLSNVLENNNGLRIFCHYCMRCWDLNVDLLSKRYGKNVSLTDIANRAKCTKCGHKKATIQVVAL